MTGRSTASQLIQHSARTGWPDLFTPGMENSMDAPMTSANSRPE